MTGSFCCNSLGGSLQVKFSQGSLSEGVLSRYNHSGYKEVWECLQIGVPVCAW